MTDIIGSFLDKLDELFGGLTAQLSLAESERNSQAEALANALTRPIVTRNRVADRWSSGSLTAVPTDKPTNIAGRQIERGSIGVRNLSSTATDVVWVGNSLEAAQRLGHPAVPVYGGQSVVIDTTAEVWVFAAAGSVPAIMWVSTEFTLENAR